MAEKYMNMDDLAKDMVSRGPPYMDDGSRGGTMIRQRAIGSRSHHGDHDMNTPQD